MISRAWSMKLLTDVGVRYAEVLNACELVDAQDEQIGLLGRGDTERLDQLTGIVFLLNDWVREGLKKPEVKQEVRYVFYNHLKPSTRSSLVSTLSLHNSCPRPTTLSV